MLRTRDVVFDEIETYDPTKTGTDHSNTELKQAVSSVELPVIAPNFTPAGGNEYVQTFIHQITQGLYDPMF